MKRLIAAGFIALLPLLLQGCVQDDIRVSVRPDGTGTIEEKLLISNTVREFMESMTNAAEKESREEKPDGGPNKDSLKETKPEKPDEIAKMMEDAKKKSTQFGTGVRFVSAVPEKTGDAAGYRAVYAFDDIRQIRIGKEKSGKQSAPEGKAEEKENADDAIRFEFTRAAAGAPAMLTVHLPEKSRDQSKEKGAKDSGEKENAAPEQPMDPKTLEMMQTLFKGMRMSVSVRIEGSISKTNATWRQGADITLMDLDFEKILGNRDLMQKMTTGKPESFADMKALFHKVDGLKFELQNPMTVSFQQAP
ncbi:MAG: hypothetical protein HPY65_14790 [Syntrophaceae bacterium]|nr:hypothetical protein [Syntrophaceae bacterium]